MSWTTLAQSTTSWATLDSDAGVRDLSDDWEAAGQPKGNLDEPDTEWAEPTEPVGAWS